MQTPPALFSFAATACRLRGSPTATVFFSFFLFPLFFSTLYLIPLSMRARKDRHSAPSPLAHTRPLRSTALALMPPSGIRVWLFLVGEPKDLLL